MFISHGATRGRVFYKSKKAVRYAGLAQQFPKRAKEVSPAGSVTSKPSPVGEGGFCVAKDG